MKSIQIRRFSWSFFGYFWRCGEVTTKGSTLVNRILPFFCHRQQILCYIKYFCKPKLKFRENHIKIFIFLFLCQTVISWFIYLSFSIVVDCWWSVKMCSKKCCKIYRKAALVAASGVKNSIFPAWLFVCILRDSVELNMTMWFLSKICVLHVEAYYILLFTQSTFGVTTLGAWATAHSMTNQLSELTTVSAVVSLYFSL